MNFLSNLRIQLRSWLAVVLMAVLAPFCLPFSRLWRHRIGACRKARRNPFLALEVPLGEFLGDSVNVIITDVAARTHNVSEAELVSLAALVAQCRFRRIFEIGTFDGRTTRCLAANVPVEGQVFTLNLPPDGRKPALDLSSVDFNLSRNVASGMRFKGTAEASRITQLWGDSATFDYSPYMGTMDMVFVDGAHTSQYAANDARVAMDLLNSRGGLIVFHDSTLFGVVTFLKGWIAANHAPFRVIEGTTLGVVARANDTFIDPVTFCKDKTDLYHSTVCLKQR
jgi:predicted O-methyltransferase YrrM